MRRYSRSVTSRLIVRWIPVLVTALLAGIAITPRSAAAAVEVVSLHSGNGLLGDQDSKITYLQASSDTCCSQFPSTFTSAEFLAAQGGPPASVRSPYAGWITALGCDPAAQWIAEDLNGDTHTTLYACPFDVNACCIAAAQLTFCWAVDDHLGGASINPAGVYLNGDPLSSISGGGPSSESNAGPVDVTSMVQCGRNWIYVYDRDIYSIISGVMFSATLDITPCAVPAEPSTWSTIKTMYH